MYTASYPRLLIRVFVRWRMRCFGTEENVDRSGRGRRFANWKTMPITICESQRIVVSVLIFVQRLWIRKIGVESRILRGSVREGVQCVRSSGELVRTGETAL